MSEHRCSVDKLDVQWQSQLFMDETPNAQPKSQVAGWRANFICKVCSKERTWEQLIEVMPFKELTDGQTHS